MSIMKGGLFMAVAMAAAAIMAADAQQQPVGPASCMPAIASMSPCLAFIGANSSSASPSSSCCAQLAAVVQTQARCLCAALGPAAAQLGVAMNQTKALSLPGACNITAPPVSQCNAIAGAPAGSPAEAPAAPAPAPAPTSATTTDEASAAASPVPSAPPAASTSPAPKVPAAGGSKTVPSATPANAAAGFVAGVQALVSFVAAAACVVALSG